MKLRTQMLFGFAAMLGLATLAITLSHQGERFGNPAMFGGAGLALALLIGAMLTLWRQVFRQIGGEPADIAKVAQQIARGDLEIELPGDSGIAAAVGVVTATLKDVARQTNAIASGDYSANIAPRSDKDELGVALQAMTAALRAAHQTTTALDWLKSGLARLSAAIGGDPVIETLAAKAISEIATYLDAQVGALYLVRDGALPSLVLRGSYAYSRRKNLSNEFAFGEGLVGQAALERQQILIRNVPEDYVRVTSGVGERLPRFICVTPFLYENRLKGVIEIGTLGEITPLQMDYLVQAMPLLAITIESAQAREIQAQLLE